jgi:hypothetical protein
VSHLDEVTFGLPDTSAGMETDTCGWPEGGFVRHVPVSFGCNHVMSTVEGPGCFIKDTGASEKQNETFTMTRLLRGECGRQDFSVQDATALPINDSPAFLAVVWNIIWRDMCTLSGVMAVSVNYNRSQRFT